MINVSRSKLVGLTAHCVVALAFLQQTANVFAVGDNGECYTYASNSSDGTCQRVPGSCSSQSADYNIFCHSTTEPTKCMAVPAPNGTITVTLTTVSGICLDFGNGPFCFIGPNNQRAEFWDGTTWKTAPRPLVETWLDR